MITENIDINDQPNWCSRYFKEFQNWIKNEAPKEMPAGYSDWAELFSQHCKISFHFTIEMNNDQTSATGFNFMWESEQDQLAFKSKFSPQKPPAQCVTILKLTC